jgi:hypothetical protein
MGCHRSSCNGFQWTLRIENGKTVGFEVIKSYLGIYQIELVNGQWATPSNLDNLDGCTAGETHSVTYDRERDEAPVLTVTTIQDITCNWNSGEGTKWQYMCQLIVCVTSHEGKTHPKLTMV